jgi:hypothetical protein
MNRIVATPFEFGWKAGFPAALIGCEVGLFEDRRTAASQIDNASKLFSAAG